MGLLLTSSHCQITLHVKETSEAYTLVSYLFLSKEPCALLCSVVMFRVHSGLNFDAAQVSNHPLITHCLLTCRRGAMSGKKGRPKAGVAGPGGPSMTGKLDVIGLGAFAVSLHTGSNFHFSRFWRSSRP